MLSAVTQRAKQVPGLSYTRLTQNVMRTQIKQYQVRLQGLKGHHRTPCDAYATWIDSHDATEYEMYVHIAKRRLDTVQAAP